MHMLWMFTILCLVLKMNCVEFIVHLQDCPNEFPWIMIDGEKSSAMNLNEFHYLNYIQITINRYDI